MVRQVHEGQTSVRNTADQIELDWYAPKMNGYEAAMAGIDCPQRTAFIRKIEGEGRL